MSAAGGAGPVATPEAGTAHLRPPTGGDRHAPASSAGRALGRRWPEDFDAVAPGDCSQPLDVYRSCWGQRSPHSRPASRADEVREPGRGAHREQSRATRSNTEGVGDALRQEDPGPRASAEPVIPADEGRLAVEDVPRLVLAVMHMERSGVLPGHVLI